MLDKHLRMIGDLVCVGGLELDIASQGDSVEAAKLNLKEAIELFFEIADPSEIQSRLANELFITSLEVNCGEA
jgi:hypothetical protein